MTITFKHKAAICLALATAFFTAQSFYAGYKKKQTPKALTWIRFPNARAVFCVPLFDTSAAEIPALKGWGHYRWKVSTKVDSAQFYFNQGINMYYAFHSIEAIASFIKATKLDSTCAMAWWGKSLAMGPTINYPNGYAPPTGAYEASVKAVQLMGTATSLEKELITAMKQRYSADTTISVRQLRTNYANAMRAVYLKMPKNADVVTLYADGLLLLHPWDLYEHDFTPKAWTGQIRSLLEQALALSPKHPGANHYYIHTMEGSATPQTALASAHLLDTLMPLVSHVTHMPSHIYIRTGDYARGIRDNNAAVEGYKTYLKQYAPVVEGAVLYQVHNVHLKINCAQMGGNYHTAITNSDSIKTDAEPVLFMKGGIGNFIQYAYMQPVFTAVRFGKWDDVLKANTPDSLAYASVLMHFAKGLAWNSKGNMASAKKELAMMTERMKDPSLKELIDNSNSAYAASGVAVQILEGVIAQSQKDYKKAIATLESAVTDEDKLIYNEPRDWPIPARHYLSNTLLAAGRYTDAATVLQQDLRINPNNGWALTGLQLVYQSTGNTIALQKVKKQLKAAWKIKDTQIDRPAF